MKKDMGSRLSTLFGKVLEMQTDCYCKGTPKPLVCQVYQYAVLDLVRRFFEDGVLKRYSRVANLYAPMPKECPYAAPTSVLPWVVFKGIEHDFGQEKDREDNPAPALLSLLLERHYTAVSCSGIPRESDNQNDGIERSGHAVGFDYKTGELLLSCRKNHIKSGQYIPTKPERIALPSGFDLKAEFFKGWSATPQEEEKTLKILGQWLKEAKRPTATASLVA